MNTKKNPYVRGCAAILVVALLLPLIITVLSQLAMF